jgi:hypothetical protein
MKKTKPTPSILERASRMARRPLPVSSKDELKMQKTQSKVSERSKWGTILEDLDSFSNDIASYTSTTMTESVVTETSIYTSTSASSATAAAAAAAPLHSDAVERPPLPPSSHTENYAQLPNADTSSEKIHMEEFQVAEAPKDYWMEEKECNERGDDGETEDCYLSDEEDYADYMYESLLDETEFAQGLCGYMEGFEPPIIHDISAAHSARRKFSDEQIPTPIIEYENNMSSSKYNKSDDLICANCGGRADGCGGGQFCC